jgi:tRNA(adenine34) deaminase
MDDKGFMKEAFEEARKAYDLGEVPVGAVVVFQNQIIARSYNQVESLKDATAHAETLAIRQAAAHLSNWRLLECTLYCTLEPCLMCAGAMILSRLKKAVWAAPDLRHGAGGSFATHPIHKVEVCQGIFETESADLLKRFFQERRCKTSLMS